MAKTEAGGVLRVDAARNRERILHAARTAFAERGSEVPLDEIARLADVGIATLYRRFPSREELVAAVFEPKVVAYAAAADAALSRDDPWEGFTEYVRGVCAMQAADAGFADVLALTSPSTPEQEGQMKVVLGKVRKLVDRAKQAGALRDDFVLEDLIILMMANAGVVNASRRHAPKAWERFAAYMLDAFRAPAASVLPRPASEARMVRLMRNR